LYRNLKNERFTDVAEVQSIAQATRLLSGWGLKFFDYDNDGEVDLILANGHPDDMVSERSQTSLTGTAAFVSSGKRKASKREFRSGAGILPRFSREDWQS